MKKMLPFVLVLFALIFTVTACTSKTDPNAVAEARLAAYKDSMRKVSDTAGLAQFQSWKAQNELAEVQYDEQTVQYAAAAPVKKRSYAPARKITRSSSASRNNGGSMNSESSNTAMRKKGWSKAAKGTAIGTAGGAVVGAVINKKNRVVGGVVGGVLGAGVGYGIGRAKDKKDGRY
jgi:hypothetical protein